MVSVLGSWDSGSKLLCFVFVYRVLNKQALCKPIGRAACVYGNFLKLGVRIVRILFLGGGVHI